MGDTLNDFFIERGALRGDPTAALARLFAVPPDAVHYHPMEAIPYPPQGTKLLVGWYMRQGQYPLHLRLTPFGETTLLLSQETALKQLCSELGVSCVGDIGKDVEINWVLITPDGSMEPVGVDEDEDAVVVYPVETPAIAD